jgi:hypothetical protein
VRTPDINQAVRDVGVNPNDLTPLETPPGAADALAHASLEFDEHDGGDSLLDAPIESNSLAQQITQPIPQAGGTNVPPFIPPAIVPGWGGDPLGNFNPEEGFFATTSLPGGVRGPQSASDALNNAA